MNDSQLLHFRSYVQMFSKKLVAFSLWIDHTRWARNTWAAAAIFVLTMAVIADMVRMRCVALILRDRFEPAVRC